MPLPTNRTEQAVRRRLRFLFILLTLLPLNSAFAADATEPPAVAGSFRCQRCHAALYEQWRNGTDRKECENCHGPGRPHVLAPTFKNIARTVDKGFRHGPDKPAAAAPRDTLRVDLFVMSHCPYGISALRSLLPLLNRWKQEVRFTLYFIAHLRSDTLQAPSKAGTDPELEAGSEKCESPAGMTDGTDRYVSLHGLDEVLENQRQCLIQALFPGRLYAYLSERVRDIAGDWKKAAARAGFTKMEIAGISGRMDTPYADSLFDANIAVAARLRVTGSPTLYINGEEFADGAAPYPVERHFCQNAPRRGPCKTFPACGFDADCVRDGFEGSCESPMSPVAKCRFSPAARFTCTVLNDEECPVCHTGNLVLEIRKRFPGARMEFVPLASDSGRALVARYGLTSYPAFLFDTLAAASARFREIAHTFTRIRDRFVLQERVVKSYHLVGRSPRPNRLDIFGSFENPPFIEMLRDIKPLLLDSAHPPAFTLHPVADANGTSGPDWTLGFDSPYGPAEIREGARSRCAQALFPPAKAVAYMLCRGNDIQSRFESHAPEPPDEWKGCADSAGLDSRRLQTCTESAQGEALFRESVRLADSAGVRESAPSFLLNNYFKVTGYNSAIRRVLESELRRKGTAR